MADVVATAQDLWEIGKSDPTWLGTLKVYHKEVMVGIASGSGVGDVVTGSKNGASYTMRPTHSLEHRRASLSLAIKGLQRGFYPTRDLRVRF